jgi:predicted aspartyl protease
MARTLRLCHHPPKEARMGQIHASIAVTNPAEPGPKVVFDALVDTGAFCLTVPSSWKERLGPLPLSRIVEVETADGRIVPAEVAGPVVIRIDAFDPVAGEVLFFDVQPTEGRIEPLLGYVTLEQAGLVVDMLGNRLVRLPRLDLKPTRFASLS